MDIISLLNQTSAIVLLIKDKRIVYANKYANFFYGYDDLVDRDVIGTIVPRTETSGRDLDDLIENIEKNPNKYHFNINENITVRGDVVWIIWSNSQYKDPNGEKMLLSVGMEATDFVNRSRKLEDIFNNSLDGIALISSDFKIVDCNSSFMKMIGFDSKEELLKVDRDESSTFKSHIKELLIEKLDILKKNVSIRTHQDFQRYDGSSFVVDAVLSAIRNIKEEIVGYVLNIRDSTDIYKKATTDRLTKIYNRMHFEELAESEIRRSWRTRDNLSLILCDIDHFKNVNDTYGHLCGDQVLKGIASDIKSMLRATDIFARVGGEEFAILLPATNGADACKLAIKIKNGIEKKQFSYGDNELGVTMSFGISELNFEISMEKSMEDLFKLADQRLYYSKEHGRNRITYTNMESS
jgi:diguanylate cyclase (GGDEF)-like protein/PAS domain S-box-containing protein